MRIKGLCLHQRKFERKKGNKTLIKIHATIKDMDTSNVLECYSWIPEGEEVLDWEEKKGWWSTPGYNKQEGKYLVYFKRFFEKGEE